MLLPYFVILALSQSLFASADQAPLSKDNPKNIVAVADFPEAGPNKFTKGYVYFTSPKGDSVKVHVDMTGLPPTGGPFVYHIHQGQVFNKESCDEAGKHFDPFNGVLNCPEKGDDSGCMVGDLSGKHGWINATCFQTEYHDKYISLNPASEAYIIGRSIVFHDQSSTRFTCANINLANAEQYEHLFGSPGKGLGGSNVGPEVPKHVRSSHEIPLKPDIPKGQPEAPPAPAPGPKPTVSTAKSTSTVTITSTRAPEKPTPAPVVSASTTSKALSTSTAGSIVKPTSQTEKIEPGEGGRVRKNEESSPAVLLSSDANSSSLFKGLIGTVFGVLLGVFF